MSYFKRCHAHGTKLYSPDEFCGMCDDEFIDEDTGEKLEKEE